MPFSISRKLTVDTAGTYHATSPGSMRFMIIEEAIPIATPAVTSPVVTMKKPAHGCEYNAPNSKSNYTASVRALVLLLLSLAPKCRATDAKIAASAASPDGKLSFACPVVETNSDSGAVRAGKGAGNTLLVPPRVSPRSCVATIASVKQRGSDSPKCEGERLHRF